MFVPFRFLYGDANVDAYFLIAKLGAKKTALFLNFFQALN